MSAAYRGFNFDLMRLPSVKFSKEIPIFIEKQNIRKISRNVFHSSLPILASKSSEKRGLNVASAVQDAESFCAVRP